MTNAKRPAYPLADPPCSDLVREKELRRAWPFDLRSPLVNRRALLRRVSAAAATYAWTAACECRVDGAEPPLAVDRFSRFKNQLRGAVLSIPTSFTADMKVDYRGVERMIERALPFGIRVFSLTSGNSQYASLTYEEIQELTRVMIRAVGGQGISIASADQWDEDQVVAYAQFAARAGADAVQIMRPKVETSDKAQPDADEGKADNHRVDEDKIVAFFRRIADATELPIVLHGEFAPSLLEKLASIAAIVAMKQDVGLEYYIDVQRKFGERYAIFEGGPEYVFLAALPYGAPASYTTLGTFAPQLTRQFWDAVDRKDYAEAYRLVIVYEHPFFDRWSHAFWRASLEHFGVAARYLRPPNASFTDEQMTEVAAFYKSLGLS